MSHRSQPQPTPDPQSSPRPTWAGPEAVTHEPGATELNAAQDGPQIAFGSAPLNGPEQLPAHEAANHEAASSQSSAASPDDTEQTQVVAARPTVQDDTEQRQLGRQPAEIAVAPGKPRAAAAPRFSPQERLRRQNWMGLGSRVLGGLATLGVLLAALGSGWSWSSVLFVWVLLTILADEFGGWFGYIAVFMGLLTLLLGTQPADTWKVLLPLVGGALLAMLVVKHSGGWGVLPFAGAVFALPLFAAAQYGHVLDKNLLLVADPDLQRSAMLAMLVGLGISLVRQFILWVVDLSHRRAERRLLRADQVPLVKG